LLCSFLDKRIVEIHGFLQPLNDKAGDGFAGPFDRLLHQRFFALRKRIQHKVSGFHAVWTRADSAAQAGESIVAKLLNHRFNAAVTAAAAIAAQADAAERQIEIVVHDQQMRKLHLVAIEQRANGCSAAVHVGLWQHDNDQPSILRYSIDQGLMFTCLRGLLTAQIGLEHIKAPIVSGAGVSPARVSQADDHDSFARFEERRLFIAMFFKEQ